MSSAQSAPAPTPAKVIPTEVGWQFVPQYYTFVNKQPQRLHCFYTKNSTFIHGTEGEDGKPSYGQHEIHQKILSIGFQDCKVFIHSVDAQASANNGIVIQVIGEMSNRGEPWRKFAQTFFLAEQPNGYFVLNDIFRYLKEESDDDVEAEEETAAVAENGPASIPDIADEPIVPEPAPAVAAEASTHPNPAQQSRADPPPAIEETLQPVEPPVADVHDAPTLTNGVHAPTGVDAPISPPPAQEQELAPESLETPEIATSAVESAPETADTPEPTPAVETADPATPAQQPTPAATPPVTPAPPAAPAKPKSWAALAASKTNAWGSSLAADAKGVSTAAASTSSAPTRGAPPQRNGTTARNGPAPPAATGTEGTRSQTNGEHAAPGGLNVTTPQCFVKFYPNAQSIVDLIDASSLRTILIQRFGPLKELEIVKSKACAFLEFNTVESARKAIQASLPVSQGGEGGVRLTNLQTDAGGDAPRVIVETRKERGDRPAPRSRGGAPDRGGFRGAGGRGRGGAGRGGASTPK